LGKGNFAGKVRTCDTIPNDPRRVVRWVQIAREEAENL
jgi:hypothetical protein